MLIAIAAIGGGVGWIIASYSDDRFQICREEFAPSATSAATRVCGPITGDAILMGFLAALVLVPVVVLMRPFISKFGFAGASIELTAIELAKKADKKASSADKRASLALVKSSTVTPFGLPPVDTGGPGDGGPATAGYAAVSAEWTAARAEFLNAWGRIAERLEPLATTPKPHTGRLRDIYDVSQRFSFDIEVLRATKEILDDAPRQLGEEDLKPQVERAKFVAARLDSVVNS